MLPSGEHGEMGTASFEALCSLILYVLIYTSYKSVLRLTHLLFARRRLIKSCNLAY